MTDKITQSSVMPKQVSLRLPDGIWERAEAVAGKMAERPEFQGLAVSPSRALIQAILRGLPEIEEEHGVKSTQKARKR